MQQVIVTHSPQTGQPLPRVQNISCILTPSNGKGGLYLGNYFGTQNVQNLKEYGIRAVLTTSIETPVSFNPQDIPFHKKIAAHDRQNFSMTEYIEQCVSFIEEYRQITNVYVHCYAGKSRSTTMIIAYLMKAFRWGFEATLHFVRFKRIIAEPNQGFVVQLRAYEKTLGITPRPGFPPEQELSRSQVPVVRQQIKQQLPPQQLPPQHMPQQNQYPQGGSSPQRRVVFAVPQQGQNNYGQSSTLLSPRQPVMMAPQGYQTQVVGGQRPQVLQQPPPQMIPQMRPPAKTRHDQIPIPKFGSKREVIKQSPPKQQVKPQQFVKPPQRSNKQIKGGFIRPKDLPGYKQS